MSRGRYTTVVPSARRLMASLRDIGYDLASAVADIVDNSIDAGARRVDVTLHADGAESWLRVADDGLGMRRGELDEAMRYGSEEAYGERSLGQFGLGLKTASLSQCRRLTVASRKGPRGRVCVRRWDLDRVADRDAWELECPPAREWPEHLVELLRAGPGTVVLWERLDRMLSLRRPDGSGADRALDAMAREIAVHLGMVFHRFLSGEATDGRRPLALALNGHPVPAWDPFARAEPHTRQLAAQSLELSDGAAVEIRPYVLPPQTRFSSAEAHQAAGGPNRWNRAQGLYIYRRDRLIQSGGWNRLRTMDEHAKLARIAIDLPVGREDAFQINVAKMSVNLPADLRPALRALVSAVVAEAQRSYRSITAPEAAAPRRQREDIDDERGLRISRDWPVILDAVAEELGHQPELRDRLLLRLANAPTPGRARTSGAEDGVAGPPGAVVPRALASGG